LIDKSSGIWHVSHPSAISWNKFALVTAEILKLKTELIKVVKNTDELGYKAIRPTYSALTSSKGCLMPDLENGIERFIKDRALNFAA
jgi:dTDP-4-dehydrorhamnose reductase